MAGPAEQPFFCQSCRTRLSITDIDALDQPGPSGRHSALLTGSIFGGTRTDESFVLLDSSKRAGANLDAHQAPGAAGRNLDESFVLLAGSASVLRQGQASSAGQHQLAAAAHAGQQQGTPLQALDDRFAQLARIFELASGESPVDQPLCLECAARVREEAEAAAAEAEAQCAAYEAALERLAKEDAQPLSDEEFARRMAAAEEEERAEALRAEAAEAALAVANRELEGAKAQAASLGKLEAHYWHDFNDLQAQLRAHVDERDVLLRKIDRTGAHLERLRRTNVLNDAFFIWHEGPFGTISGFRLGRTPSQPVDWDEINAAWGQAVLLLHTLAQACKLNFSAGRLVPLGSYPRLLDKKGGHDLFGPVNKLYCTAYDRAAVLFLSCLREFAEFAAARDVSEAVPGRTPLELPYAIDGDRVGNLTIKLMFNKDARWTKALKYMLTDLKWCMSWMIGRQDGGGGGLQEPRAQAAEQPGRGGMSSVAASMQRGRAESR